MLKNNSLLIRENDRVIYFDWLRIIATLAVIVIHCSIKDSLEVNSIEWNTMNFYFCLSQWAVPVFVMISGSLFLGREIALRTLMKKNVLRIATAFLFWSVLYALWRYYVTQEKNSVEEMVIAMIKGHYHMWFLFVIIGLYLIVPFLNKIVESKSLAIYYVALAFLFSVLFPQIVEVIGLKYVGPSVLLNEFISKFRLEFLLGYTIYFVLGYLLRQKTIDKKIEIVFYALGLCGFLITVFVSVCSSRMQVPIDIFCDELTVNILLMSIAVFVFAKQHLNKPLKSEKSMRVLSYISKCTFGIYLVHPLVIYCMQKFLGITAQSLNPIVSVPLVALLVFVSSLCISAVLNKIPFVKKWFV